MASEQDIESFIAITGATRHAAEQILELSGFDVNQAIQLWFTDEDLQRSLNNAGPSTTTTTSARPSTQQNRSRIGREDAHGVIHIDSDDDVDMTENDFDDGAEKAAAIARQAQEEEDAAIAKRLQEELYGSQPADEVRAPLARTTETLVAPTYGDDDHSAILEQFRRRQTRGEASVLLTTLDLD